MLLILHSKGMEGYFDPFCVPGFYVVVERVAGPTLI